MIHFFIFVYTVFILCYVIEIKNNQDKIIVKLEQIHSFPNRSGTESVGDRRL